MSHPEQREFCASLRDRFPHLFSGVSVLDCGSLDINGNNRYLFEDCRYIGIDIGHGPNVDIACRTHKFTGSDFDVVCSTEALEHDRCWRESIPAMAVMAKSLMFFTCATHGRQEHGTTAHHSDAAPYTNDWYKNIDERDVREVLDLLQFKHYAFEVNRVSCDLYFWGIK